MAVYQTDPKVMQVSLNMTHALLKIGLGYVPIPVLSPEHYEELMELHEKNLLILQEQAEEAPPAEEGIEDAEIVAPQLDSPALTDPSLPIPTKRKRKQLKQQSTEKDNTDGSL